MVSVTQQGQAAPVQVGQLNLTTFMNDTGEQWRKPLHRNAISGAPNESTPGLNGAGLLYQGYVETSNVNVAEELVNMIQVQRAYEINSKAVSPPIRCCKNDATLRQPVAGSTGLLILKMIAIKNAAHLMPFPACWCFH